MLGINNNNKNKPRKTKGIFIVSEQKKLITRVMSGSWNAGALGGNGQINALWTGILNLYREGVVANWGGGMGGVFGNGLWAYRWELKHSMIRTLKQAALSGMWAESLKSCIIVEAKSTHYSGLVSAQPEKHLWTLAWEQCPLQDPGRSEWETDIKGK